MKPVLITYSEKRLNPGPTRSGSSTPFRSCRSPKGPPTSVCTRLTESSARKRRHEGVKTVRVGTTSVVDDAVPADAVLLTYFATLAYHKGGLKGLKS